MFAQLAEQAAPFKWVSLAAAHEHKASRLACVYADVERQLCDALNAHLAFEGTLAAVDDAQSDAGAARALQ